MDAAAERERISREIRELERILDPGSSRLHADVSGSSLDLDSDSDADSPGDDAASDAAAPPVSEEECWGEASLDGDEAWERALPRDPESCLQLNMVYQEVVSEKLAEVRLLLAQNREQQEELAWGLAGARGPRAKDGRSLPPNTFVGHFMKPYFKDKVTGVGPPANEDARDKAAQGIKAFEELLVTKWKTWEKALLRSSVVSGRLQRLLQPKLLKLEYLRQKQSRAGSEAERQVLEKQAQEAEREVQEINQLPEDALLGDRLDNHDWEKIANVSFEGARGAGEIRKFWQNSEHPSINKQEWGAQELERLEAVAARHGHLDWQAIADELGTRRSAFQCLQEFQRRNPALKRKEWTEAEDRMLSQLVQEMRVGRHIPYRRIVYYMEGRDSVQLIYRWTKSLDPGLRKGAWAPEEDAKLLRAVAKHGEQDWFKIREEVPGRSDAQCRDRYLRRLHFSLKKGRWAPEEERRLRELIDKHGAGHWAKIAAELPHRTGSQCLSKWKIMARKRGRQRRRPPRSVRWSSSSEESSGEDGGSVGSTGSEDSEPEDAPRDSPALPPPPRPVLDLELWVPARLRAPQLWPGGPGAARGGPGEAAGEVVGWAPSPSGAPRAPPPPAGARPQDAEGTVDQVRRPPKVPLETVLQVLRANTAARCRPPRRRPGPPCPPGTHPSSSGAPGPCGQEAAGPRLQRRGHALQSRLLDRQLLVAVSPWVGDVVLPDPAQRPARAPTRAHAVGEQLRGARLASTPVFALFIQLLRIDAAGCMEVVRERKAAPPPPPPGVPTRAQQGPGGLPPDLPAQGAGAKPRPGLGGGSAPQAPRAAPAGPRPKPKTVSELLREKRAREARARRTAPSPAAPPPPPGPGPGTPGPVASTPGQGPAVLPALALLTAPAGATRALAPHDGAPAARPKQGLPEPPLFLPAAPSPATPPVQPLGLAPTLATRAGLPHGPAGPPLPVTWLLTTQGLLPVPALLGLPGPAAPPDPGGQGASPGPGQLEVPAGRGSLLLGQACPARVPATTATEPRPPPGATSAVDAEPQPPPRAAPTVDAEPQPPPGATSAVDAEPQPPPGAAPAVDVEPQPPPGAAPAVDAEPQLPPGAAPAVDAEPQPPPGAAPAVDTEPQPPPGAIPAASLPAVADRGVTCAPGAPSTSPQAALSAEDPPVRPPGLERPSPPPGPEKGAPDWRLLFRESEASVRAWLRVPPRGGRLAYQPPALCGLRALAGLLLRKAALEARAAALAPGEALPAALARVRTQLRDCPAYLLLRARFLAAFTLPALLAGLPPRGVPTTLAAAGPDEDEDLELWAGVSPERGAAASAGEDAAPSPRGSDQLEAPGPRPARKRRRRL